MIKTNKEKLKQFNDKWLDSNAVGRIIITFTNPLELLVATKAVYEFENHADEDSIELALASARLVFSLPIPFANIPHLLGSNFKILLYSLK